LGSFFDMRFDELKIVTRRERPARVGTDGEALLIRAGYQTDDGALTALGEKAIATLGHLTLENPGHFSAMGIPAFSTIDEELVGGVPGADAVFLCCGACGYAASAEAAQARKLPPPPEQLLEIETVETPGCNTIESLAEYLRVSRAKTAKALLYTRSLEAGLVFVVIRGDTKLSERKLVAAVGALRPASPAEIVAAGAVPGYASPIGLAGALVVVDDLIPVSSNLVAGANKPGYHLLNTNFTRDYSAEFVLDLTLAAAGDLCTVCGSPLEARRGVVLRDQAGTRPTAILRAIAEMHHDEMGLRFPAGTAPFDTYLLHIPGKELDTKAAAEALYVAIMKTGTSVLFDDREQRAGVKFNDADLIGCPFRVTVSERRLHDQMVELKRRSDPDIQLIPVDELAESLRSLARTPW